MALRRSWSWVVLALVACTAAEDGDAERASMGEPAAPSSATPANPSGTNDAAGGPGSGSPTSGLPYAHVVAVEASGSEGAFSFSVSVESADVDCSQYADWWEVLSEDGALLYRRILEHSHTDENGTTDADAPGNTFTRSGGPVPVDGDEVVLVRAHMNPSGYHGRVLRGSAGTGFEVATDLEDGFARDVEAIDPLPTNCLF